MNNHKTIFYIRVVALLNLLVGCFFIYFCVEVKTEPRFRKLVKIYHLADNSYCYQDRDFGHWFWLGRVINNKFELFAQEDNGYIQPNGYLWTMLPVEPDSDEITLIDDQKPERAWEQEIVVNKKGQPLLNKLGNLINPAELRENEGYDTSTPNEEPETDSTISRESSTEAVAPHR